MKWYSLLAVAMLMAACGGGGNPVSATCVKQVQVDTGRCPLSSMDSQIYSSEFVCSNDSDTPTDPNCQYKGLYSNIGGDKHTVWCCTDVSQQSTDAGVANNDVNNSTSSSSSGGSSSSSGSSSGTSSSSGGSSSGVVLTCPIGSTQCGTTAEYCTPAGSTCCASVGLPQLSCPNGGTCNTDGICTGTCANASGQFTCGTGATPYSCTGPMTPTDTNSGVYVSGLTCSNGTAGIGSTVYCCIQECAPPAGTYQYVWTTTSGTCGDIASSKQVISSGSTILNIGYVAELCTGTNQRYTQSGSNTSTNLCSGSVSSTCIGDGVVNNISGVPAYSNFSVVDITSNQTGTQFSGTTSLTETDVNTGMVLCNGTYSFVATQTSP